MKARVWLQYQQRSLVSCTVLILILCCTTLAQTDPAGGSRNTIQGDIITPNGQRLDHPVMVWLMTSRGETSTTSNGNGSFVFRQLGGGRFAVRVDAGDAYETATDVVNIPDTGTIGTMSRMGQIYSLQIHLRLK